MRSMVGKKTGQGYWHGHTDSSKRAPDVFLSEASIPNRGPRAFQ